MPEPFACFYPDALLYLTRLGDVEALGVLFALSKYANQFGGCDPGDERLGILTGHRKDAIPAILERLQAIDYAHIIETPVVYRPKPLRGFQISPYVLRLRPDCHASALVDWQRFNLQTKPHYEKQTTPITHAENDLQPESESEPALQPALKPESATSILRKSSAVHDNQNTDGASGADQPRLEGEGQKPGQGQGDPAPQAQAVEPPSNARAIPPSAAPPLTEPKSLRHYKRPLADENNENLALDVVSLTGDMSRENARMLVETYGWEWVMWVMTLYRKHDMSVEHPARWIRAMLRKTTTELRQRA